MEVLLNIWRDIGKQQRLSISVQSIGEHLCRRLPLGFVEICRSDPAFYRFETMAIFATATIDPTDFHRLELSPGNFENLLRCMAESGVLGHNNTEVPSAFEKVQHLRGSLDVLLVPLFENDAVAGMLVLGAAEGRRFNADHAALAGKLSEPISAAFVSEHTIRKLEQEHQAMAADKSALLSRLERADISESVVGADTGLRDIMEQVKQVSRSDAPVLILGETGSGKEVIARAIHQGSPFSAGPMLRVNCGAIPPELVDSELFGHEKGSFTGAVASRKGWFERADGGTLFLDEIGDLPLAAQVRLLRVLQDGVMERVGGERTIAVNVRVVAATNANLKEMVEKGQFRQDLWYRLAVFPIHLPPLRERPGDIPRLAAHFAWRSGKRLGGTPLIPDAADNSLLLSYSWPGNVRELAAVIERATILGDGKHLRIADALGIRTDARTTSAFPITDIRSSTTLSDTHFMTLDEALESHIRKALGMADGRIEGPHGAAKILKINPHTLRAKMRKLKIEWQSYRASS